MKKKHNSSVSLIDLPDELILNILRLLKPRLLARVAQTCRRLCALVHDPYPWRDYTDDVPLEVVRAEISAAMPSTFAVGTLAPYIQCAMFPSDEAVDNAAGFTALRTLCVTEGVSGRRIASLVERNPRLVRLAVPRVRFAYRELRAICTAASRLVDVQFGTVNLMALNLISRKCKLLRRFAAHLELSPVPVEEEAACVLPFENVDCLKLTANAQSVPGSMWPLLTMVFRLFPNVREFEFKHPQFDMFVLPVIAQHFPRLEQLVLCLQDDPAGTNELAKALIDLPNLRVLEFHSRVPEYMLQMLPKVAQLEELRLLGQKLFFVEEMRNIENCAPTLSQLHLTLSHPALSANRGGDFYISQARIMQKLVGLTTLHLTTNFVQDGAIAATLPFLSKLRHLRLFVNLNKQDVLAVADCLPNLATLDISFFASECQDALDTLTQADRLHDLQYLRLNCMVSTRHLINIARGCSGGPLNTIWIKVNTRQVNVQRTVREFVKRCPEIRHLTVNTEIDPHHRHSGHRMLVNANGDVCDVYVHELYRVMGVKF